MLVVGGGITGAGVALDAATRGLSVALVEKRDFAAGTSSRSSKLIHGGLRYLEQRDFSLVREALHERALLLTSLAPHLVEPVPFLFPLRHRSWERAYIGAGVGLYDALAGRALRRSRATGTSRATAALELAPALRPDSLVGAIRYHDARIDDARFVVALVRTAVAHGALAVSGLRVDGLALGRGRAAPRRPARHRARPRAASCAPASSSTRPGSGAASWSGSAGVADAGRGARLQGRAPAGPARADLLARPRWSCAPSAASSS